MFKRTNLSVAVGFALIASAPTSAIAQDAAQAANIEEVVVTGSRIARDPLSTTGPITLMDSESIAESGVTSVDDLLRELPSMGTNGIGKNSNNGGAGMSTVDLRQLGTDRTLVLVNGRRYVASSTGTGAAVDLGNIPVAMIERVEVLTDGASAVYGSDAVAGVINIVTKSDFDGVELSAQTGDSFSGGGATNELSVTFGNSGDGYSLVGGLSYNKMEEISYSDRDWANYYSSNNPLGTIKTGMGGNTQLYPTGNADAPYDARYESFNLQDMWLQGASERIGFNLNGKFEINDTTEAYFESSFANRRSSQQLAGQPMPNTFADPSKFDADQKAALDSWWESQGFDHTDYASYWADSNSKMIDIPEGCEGGNWDSTYTDKDGNEQYCYYTGVNSRADKARISSQDSNTVRLLAGVDGEFKNGWSWDVFGSYGESSISETIENSINKTEYDAAIAAGANPIGGWDDDLQASYYTDFSTSEYVMKNFGASVAGELGMLPGGEIGFAAGAEYRDEWTRSTPSIETANGDTAGNQTLPTEGGYHVTEVFAEFNLPVLQGVKYADELSFDAAVRYSDFSTFGGQGTYRLGGVWAINPEVRVRSSYSTSYRAPTVYDLYQGAAQSYEGLADPCSSDYSGTLAEGACNGVPGSYTQTDTQLPVSFTGNEDLQPEEADTFTFGVVYTPDFAEDLSFTIDYYDITIDNSIGVVSTSTMLEDCYTNGNQATCDSLSVERDPQGNITNMQNQLQNTGFIETSGIDVDLTQNMYFDAGELSYSIQVNYLLTYDFENPDGSVEDDIGYVTSIGSAVYSEWRGLANVQWTADRWSMGATVQYIGEGYNDDYAIYGPEYYNNIDAVTYLDLNGSYKLSETAMLRAGIDNVLDKEPQMITVFDDVNGSYDFRGRYFWVGVTASF